MYELERNQMTPVLLLVLLGLSILGCADPFRRGTCDYDPVEEDEIRAWFADYMGEDHTYMEEANGNTLILTVRIDELVPASETPEEIIGRPRSKYVADTRFCEGEWSRMGARGVFSVALVGATGELEEILTDHPYFGAVTGNRTNNPDELAFSSLDADGLTPDGGLYEFEVRTDYAFEDMRMSRLHLSRDPRLEWPSYTW